MDRKYVIYEPLEALKRLKESKTLRLTGVSQNQKIIKRIYWSNFHQILVILQDHKLGYQGND